MKRVLIGLLDFAAWILRIIIAPLRFILRLVWPSVKLGQTGQTSEQSPAQTQAENQVQPAIATTFTKVIVPANLTEQPLSEAEIIKPASKVKPGWFSLPLENLLHPTYWPVVLGLGLIFGAFGVVTSFVFSLVGLLLFILGLVGWIGDMWHEQ